MLSPIHLSFLLSLPLLTTAQRPPSISICDYYTSALLSSNTPATQYTVLSLLVNTVVFGNYTQPNVGVVVPGILAAGEYDGEQVNLLPYFDGCLNSTSRGGLPVSRNFLDGGGAPPLIAGGPGAEGSRQARLLLRLYSFFGRLLGCSGYGQPGFPIYDGPASMHTVHRFMALSPAEVGYFIQQVRLAGLSFGVAEDDADAVGCALSSTFGFRCSPPTSPLADGNSTLQSICTSQECPVDEAGECGLYPAQGISAEPLESVPGCRGPV